MKFKDYYEVLGIGRGASQDEVRSAFRKLARKFHPDVAADKANAEEKFKELNEAYEVLGDPEKRKKYDALGADWRHAGAAGGGGGGWSGADFGSAGGGDWHFEGTGFSDFFETYFGTHGSPGGFAGGATRRGGFPGGGQRAGRDIESEILVTVDEVMHGSERVLAVSAPTGDRRTVRIRIPMGVSEGQLIRAAGLGQPGSFGGLSGDLFLRVRLERHPEFRIDGHDVIHDLNLAPWEAVLGATIPVRTPHGLTKVKIPAGTAAGTQLRLAGKGLPVGTTGKFGDFFACLAIVTPTHASPAEQTHWQALAELSSFQPR